MTDHKDNQRFVAPAEGADMRHLTKPRGKGYSLRMKTPDALIGTENPFTGRPFGREIKFGLNTRKHSEAVRIREVRVGQIRQLEAEALASNGIGSIIDLSPESAEQWRQMRVEASDAQRDGMDYVLADQLEAAAEAGRGSDAEVFGARVFKGAIPLEDALERYLKEREPGNVFGFDPLARTTALNVRSTVGHLRAFLGGEQPLLQDVTPDQAFKFRTAYLPIEKGLAAGTAAKHMTLLRGMWSWAINDRQYLKTRSGKPVANPWLVATGGTPRRKAVSAREANGRTAYTAEQVAALLKGYPNWGTRQGDILRLLLVTGCRADEIGALALSNVAAGGEGFHIVKGKTAKAARYVPVVGVARELLKRRIEAVTLAQAGMPSEERRLFPEWSLKPSTRKANGLSQWFTRYRRKTLGKQSDGALALHSFRHTWRTAARRAGVADDRVRELGGWEGEDAGKRSAASIYDHGLEAEQLKEAQEAIWDGLERQGYLKAF